MTQDKTILYKGACVHLWVCKWVNKKHWSCDDINMCVSHKVWNLIDKLHWKNSLSFEECDVEQRGIEVDKLKEVHLGSVAVIIVTLCSVKFCRMVECRKSKPKERRGEKKKWREGKREGLGSRGEEGRNERGDEKWRGERKREGRRGEKTIREMEGEEIKRNKKWLNLQLRAARKNYVSYQLMQHPDLITKLHYNVNH